MKKEIWKSVPGYENLYLVSNFGNVKTLSHTTIDIYGKSRTYKSRDRKPYIDKLGYAHIALFKNGHEERFYIHRLVAMCFLPNPNNLPYVNHIDQNPLNNHVSNLEWCTPKYNACYGDAIERRTNSKSKAVVQYSLNGEKIKEWKSAAEAARVLNLHDGDIGKCCKHMSKFKTCGGFKWEYKNIDYLLF